MPAATSRWKPERTPSFRSVAFSTHRTEPTISSFNATSPALPMVPNAQAASTSEPHS